MAPKYWCNQLTLQEEIGEGAFGTVYKGFLKGTGNVAVKLVRQSYDSIKEILRMRNLDHPKVISLLGTVPPDQHKSYCDCDMKNTNWLILEYMPKGCLLDYIYAKRGQGLCAYAMIKIAYQVALGMDYLHRTANLVHRDLAARNVLVKDDNYNVKIGDFGLSDDYTYSDHYYQDNDGNVFPVRWMSPENQPSYDCIGKFSRKGDVWSFGVLLFEMWSRGKKPFGLLAQEEIIEAVKQGKTVLDYFDLKVRYWVKALMLECFKYHKSERPNFRMIYNTISAKSEFQLESDDESDDYETESQPQSDSDSSDSDYYY